MFQSLTWQIFHHYLFSKRSGALIRTIARLCIIGVGIGIFSLVVVLSVMTGFNQTIQDRLMSTEPHLVIYGPGLDQKAAKKFLKQEKIDWVPFETQDIILRTIDGSFNGAIAKGVNKKKIDWILGKIQAAENSDALAGITDKIDSLSEGKGLETKTGDDFEDLPKPLRLKHGEVVLGVELARSLGIYEGDEITLFPPEAILQASGEIPLYERVVVSHLLYTEIQEIDSKYLFYRMGKSLKKLSQSSSLERGLEVRLDDPDDAEALAVKMQVFGGKIDTWRSRHSALFFALKMEKLVMGIFLGMTALITCFSIVTVLVLLMTQKKKELGLLMAMGLSANQTRTLFTRVGLLLSGIGMGGGFLIGISLALVLDYYPLDILPDIYYDSSIPAKVEPVMMAWIVLFSFSIALLGAWIPAWLNVRQTPGETLKS